MHSKAATVADYLSELPDERRLAIEAVRTVILDNLDAGYEEGMQYGMIGYFVPHRAYPAGYHCDPRQPLPFASLASQKNHLALYLMSLYADPDARAWFQQAWKAAGKKLDMGKCCVRFKKLGDLSLDVLGEFIRRVPAARYIAAYEQARGAPKLRKGSRATPSKAKAVRKQAVLKKTVRKKATRKKS